MAAGIEVIQLHGLFLTKAVLAYLHGWVSNCQQQRPAPTEDWHHFSGHLIENDYIRPFPPWKGSTLQSGFMVSYTALLPDQVSHFTKREHSPSIPKTWKQLTCENLVIAVWKLSLVPDEWQNLLIESCYAEELSWYGFYVEI
jgi:hypothetical protein